MPGRIRDRGPNHLVSLVVWWRRASFLWRVILTALAYELLYLELLSEYCGIWDDLACIQEMRIHSTKHK